MLRNSYILLALFLLACAPKRETLLSKWEKKSLPEVSLQRKLASDGNNKCLQDVFSVEVLKNQIAELERPYADSKRVPGRWRHLDLATLPVPQANFLKNYGYSIGNLTQPDSIDYSGCDSLPCIFNRIYGRGDEVPGYVHYIWYLRFGHMLSADNHIPNQISDIPGQYNGKEISFDKYLYSDQELYGFWRLSLMLEVPYTTLSAMKQVQRIPRGEAFEGDYKKACGLAHSDGWIILTDSPQSDPIPNPQPNMTYTVLHCLYFSKDSDKGYFYQAVTHELAHQIDFSESDRRGYFNYRSMRPDYLKFTGMTIKESVVNGVMTRRWTLDPNAKLVSPYAGTAPQENFAESLAQFRIDGDGTQRAITDEHYQFISQNYYSQHAYTNEDLVRSWQERYAKDFSVESFKMVQECSSMPSGAPSNYFTAKDFSEALPLSFIQCVGAKAQALSQDMRAKILISEPQGCSVLKSPSNQILWDDPFKQNMIVAIQKNLENLKNDSGYFQKVAKAYDLLQDHSISRDAFFACAEDSSPKICYESAIQNFFQTSVTGLKSEDVSELTHLYLEKKTYDTVAGEIRHSYMTLVSSFEEKIRNEAASLWKVCKAVPLNDIQPPTGDFFLIGSGYLVSSIYNCVNSQYEKNISSVIQSISVDGQLVGNPKEENFLSQIIKEKFRARLKQLYELDSMEEERRASAIVKKESETLFTYMKSDLSWLNGKGDALLACEAYALPRVEFEPIFFVRKDLLSPLLKQTLCQRLAADPFISNFSIEQKNKLKANVVKDLHNSMYEILVKRAIDCLERFPKDTKAKYFLYKVPREVCVNQDWASLEYDVAYSKRASPEVKNLGLSVSALEQILYNNRPAQKARISLEYLKY